MDLLHLNMIELCTFIRSAARLAMGDIDGAFEDVKEALIIAPHYPQVSLALAFGEVVIHLAI